MCMYWDGNKSAISVKTSFKKLNVFSLGLIISSWIPHIVFTPIFLSEDPYSGYAAMSEDV